MLFFVASILTLEFLDCQRVRIKARGESSDAQSFYDVFVGSDMIRPHTALEHLICPEVILKARCLPLALSVAELG